MPAFRTSAMKVRLDASSASAGVMTLRKAVSTSRAAPAPRPSPSSSPMASATLRLSGGPLVITIGSPMTAVGFGVKNRATLALAIWARISVLGNGVPGARGVSWSSWSA